LPVLRTFKLNWAILFDLGYCNNILFQKSIREEMKQLTAQSERIKVELREYYQEQLEVVVRDKLREFQEQLDAAETSLHKELEQREHALTEMASKQVKQISEK
jgi:ABC-type transport system involved in cytochrome bd biosynthesis fused ATPase/permease subunit